MGIREKLNENPKVTTAATVAIVVIAIGFIIWQVIPQNSGPPTKQYYSDDDGKTYFADDINKIPPFDRGGKQAVKANVFKCGSGSPFVAYLEKYSDDAKKRLEGPHAAGAPVYTRDDFQTLVKKPGDAKWLTPRDRNYDRTMDVTCPNGGSDIPDQQMP